MLIFKIISVLILILITLVAICFFLFVIFDSVNLLRGGAPFVPTPKDHLSVILKLLTKNNISKDNKLIDLGSGDGRIVNYLVKHNYNACGIEFDPFVYLVSKIRSIYEFKSTDNIGRLMYGDLFKLDFTKYDVFIIYGYPPMLDELEQKILNRSKSQAYLISNRFTFKNLDYIDEIGEFTLYRVCSNDNS